MEEFYTGMTTIVRVHQSEMKQETVRAIIRQTALKVQEFLEL